MKHKAGDQNRKEKIVQFDMGEVTPNNQAINPQKQRNNYVYRHLHVYCICANQKICVAVKWEITIKNEQKIKTCILKNNSNGYNLSKSLPKFL